MTRRRHRHANTYRSFVIDLERFIWEPPERVCPKCGKATVQYYDPFFFSPLRTLQGKRRLKCSGCRFVWRPSSKNRSPMDFLKSQFWPRHGTGH